MSTQTHAERVRELGRDVAAQRWAIYREMLSLADRAEARGDVVIARQMRRQAEEYRATRIGHAD